MENSIHDIGGMITAGLCLIVFGLVALWRYNSYKAMTETLREKVPALRWWLRLFYGSGPISPRYETFNRIISIGLVIVGVILIVIGLLRLSAVNCA